MKYIVNTDCELIEVTRPEQLEDAHAIFNHRYIAEQYQLWKVKWENECLRKILQVPALSECEINFWKAELKRLKGIVS